MKELLYVDSIEQAEVLFKPQRVDVLQQLAQPRSCPEVGQVLGQSTQRVSYHVKKLVVAGLVERVAERHVNGIREGVYQAVARSYWVSPRLVPAERRQVRDEFSLGYLLDLVEHVQSELGALSPADGPVPTLGVSGQIRLKPGHRQAFFDELRTVLQELFTRHGDGQGETFRLAVACYPHEEDEGENPDE
ncbi:helix-turn-helix domain-containing protein [Nocardia brasiliensis]